MLKAEVIGSDEVVRIRSTSLMPLHYYDDVMDLIDNDTEFMALNHKYWEICEAVWEDYGMDGVPVATTKDVG